jgi:hypothetical protein
MIPFFFDRKNPRKKDNYYSSDSEGNIIHKQGKINILIGTRCKVHYSPFEGGQGDVYTHNNTVGSLFF